MPEQHLSRQTASRQTASGSPLGELRVLKQKQKIKQKRRRQLKLRRVAVAALLGGGLAYFQFKPLPKSPEAVLVLGGEPSREQFAAEFAKQHPGLPIWVSGGSNPEYAEWVFRQSGVSEGLIHLDYDAVDTLTNFTTIVDKLRSQNIRSVYLITSDYHMRRAQVIGQVVLGSRGIQFQTVSIPTRKPSEPFEKAVFDGLRAVVWVTTGETSLALKQEFQ
ncbi:YdcF family protein [Altericista sp. CCNU0014]|uniref:YdcF family protein n=1 Tax=Altericista sp. CCNU0014 TaxID=3082949 RepID=UPI00384F7C04